MRLFNDVKNYIGENNFRIILYKDKTIIHGSINIAK